jgi:hypothetical protein
MVTAPQLLGKSPPQPTHVRTTPKASGNCPAERMAFWRTWLNFDHQMVNGYDVRHSVSRAEARQRYVEADEVISTLGASLGPTSLYVMDCEGAASFAEEMLFGD